MTDAEYKASPVRKRTASGGKRYCVLCSKYERQVLENGTCVTLHRIPGGKSSSEAARRKAWLRGLKLHRPNLPINDNTRVCNLHFENCVYIPKQSVPKYFNLNRLDNKANQKRARRPLSDKFVNGSTVSSAENQNFPNAEDTSSELFFATKITEDAPDYFYDSINSCDSVVEIKESSLVYRIENSKKDGDHMYSLPPEQMRIAESSTQTERSNYGSVRPEDLENNDEKTRFYTGFPDYLTFMMFFQTFILHGADKLVYWEGQKRTLVPKTSGSNCEKPGRKRKLRPIDEFFMVCLRLRLGLLQEHLSDMFCVSVMTVSRVLNTWINFMYDNMKSLIAWPTKEQILANLPKCFSEMPDVRVVVDATEFFCEKPSSLQAQNLTWSEYKHHNTFKVLIGVSPSGLVTFISNVWGGHTSDRQIVQEDGYMFIPRLEPGDIILADKGFTIADLLPGNIGLNMPPFVSRSKQMTRDQFFKTQQIASSRIVVEMKMEQIKNFRVLQTVLPLTEAHLAEQMIVICAAITNLYDPLLK